MFVYVQDVDKIYEFVLSKGVELVEVFVDKFYGDWMGVIKDFVGNIWWIVMYMFNFYGCIGDV